LKGRFNSTGLFYIGSKDDGVGFVSCGARCNWVC
jgi:hypothetical protein